jgi:hypothetical protein
VAVGWATRPRLAQLQNRKGKIMSNTPKYYVYAVKARGKDKKSDLDPHRRGLAAKQSRRAQYRVGSPSARRKDRADAPEIRTARPRQLRKRGGLMVIAHTQSAGGSPERASSRSLRIVSRADHDIYPTPPEAVRALLSVEAFDGPIWGQPVAMARSGKSWKPVAIRYFRPI